MPRNVSHDQGKSKENPSGNGPDESSRARRFVKVYLDLLYDPLLNGEKLKVLLNIVGHSFLKGCCWASNSTMADELHLEERQVSRHVKNLWLGGWIDRRITCEGHTSTLIPRWDLLDKPCPRASICRGIWVEGCSGTPDTKDGGTPAIHDGTTPVINDGQIENLKKKTLIKKPPNPPEGGSGGDLMSKDSKSKTLEQEVDELITFFAAKHLEIRKHPSVLAHKGLARTHMKAVLGTLNAAEIKRRMVAFLKDTLDWQLKTSDAPNYSLNVFISTINRYAKQESSQPDYHWTDEDDDDKPDADREPLSWEQFREHFMVNCPAGEDREVFLKRTMKNLHEDFTDTEEWYNKHFRERPKNEPERGKADSPEASRYRRTDGQPHTIAEITAERLKGMQDRDHEARLKGEAEL